ncbi:MAG TPA: hypothetical protein EYP18_10805, partial [Desulfobacterales bacterium]|nr:hypothetical protein [Desulfobacterales bacterium]
MKKKIGVLALASLGCALCITPVYADSETPTDYELVVQATEESELDYEQLKTKLFERYTSVIERMEQSENNYTSIFSGESSIGTGAIPNGFSPWWQARVNGRINKAIPDVSTDVTSLFSRALKYSSQIRVFSDLPLIRETTIQEAEGPYDY